MRIENKHYIYLVIWITSLIFIGSIIGSFTRDEINTWYQTLNRSPLTPPNYIFPIAWTILYVMIAISGWMIWQAKQLLQLRSLKNLYLIQLILNWCWTPLFFKYHLTGLALICLLLIIIFVALLIFKSYQSIKTVAFLLIPYLLWLLFAGYLNLHIFIYN